MHTHGQGAFLYHPKGCMRGPRSTRVHDKIQEDGKSQNRTKPRKTPGALTRRPVIGQQPSVIPEYIVAYILTASFAGFFALPKNFVLHPPETATSRHGCGPVVD
jgi:hypothetical protein